MHLGLFRQQGERGDTIVEVMLVLAIVGLAIGIAFATANTSLLTVEAAQQNTQATAILEQQIENLHFLATSPSALPNPIFQTSGYFCIDGSQNPPAMSTAFAGVITDYAIYPAVCTTNGIYFAIAYNAVDDTFTVTAFWDNIQGFGQDSATLVYRLHP